MLIFVASLFATLGAAQQKFDCLGPCGKPAIQGCLTQGVQSSDLLGLMRCVRMQAKRPVWGNMEYCHKCMLKNCEPAKALVTEEMWDGPCEENYCLESVQDALTKCSVRDSQPCKVDTEQACLAVVLAGNNANLCVWGPDDQGVDKCHNRESYDGGLNKNKKCTDKNGKKPQCKKLEGCFWSGGKCMAVTEQAETWETINELKAYMANIKSAKACTEMTGIYTEKSEKCAYKNSKVTPTCNMMRSESLCAKAGCKWTKPKTKRRSRGRGQTKKATCSCQDGGLLKCKATKQRGGRGGRGARQGRNRGRGRGRGRGRR